MSMMFIKRIVLLSMVFFGVTQVTLLGVAKKKRSSESSTGKKSKSSTGKKSKSSTGKKSKSSSGSRKTAEDIRKELDADDAKAIPQRRAAADSIKGKDSLTKDEVVACLGEYVQDLKGVYADSKKSSATNAEKKAVFEQVKKDIADVLNQLEVSPYQDLGISLNDLKDLKDVQRKVGQEIGKLSK